MSNTGGSAVDAASGGAVSAAESSMSLADNRENGNGADQSSSTTAPRSAGEAATFPAMCAAIDGQLRKHGYKMPDELGMVRDVPTRRGLDVLVLSTYTVWGKELEEVWDVSGDNVSLGFWSYYCATKDFKARHRAAQPRLIPNIDWLGWARSAVRLLEPRLVVVLCWKGNPDRDFVSLWDKRRTGGLPCRDDVIELPDPKNAPDDFHAGWREKVASLLYERHLIGAERDADGAVDAFKVISQRPTDEQRAEEHRAREAPVLDSVTGENILPEHWQRRDDVVDEARQGLDDAIQRRKARAKQEALEAQILRNRSQGQRQITDLFGGEMRKRPASEALPPPPPLMRPPPAGNGEMLSTIDTGALTLGPAAPRWAFASHSATPNAQRPMWATINLSEEYAAARELEKRTGQERDEAWAREVEERIERERAEQESHPEQVSKGKYEDA